VVETTPLWAALVVPLVVGALALLAGSFDAALAGRAAGRPAAGELAAPLRTGALLLVQQRRTTLAPDALLWRAGSGGLVVVALLAAAVVPLGQWVLLDSAVGIVWFNALDVVLWALVWLLGWGANSPYALVGGYRFLAQALSYELPLMFALTAPAVAAGSLRVGDVVAAQSGLWYGVWMPVALVAYLVGVVGFAFWGPLASPASRDLAGATLADLSGPDRLLVQAGRWAVLTVGAAFAVPLFLGGGHGPLLPDWLWSLVKTLGVLAVLVVLKRRLPVVPVERLVTPAWVVLLPAVLVQLLVVSVVVLLRGPA
jgi:NADH-quinone oxidoreductase subunit H